jgi:hypothetical protein
MVVEFDIARPIDGYTEIFYVKHSAILMGDQCMWISWVILTHEFTSSLIFIKFVPTAALFMSNLQNDVPTSQLDISYPRNLISHKLRYQMYNDHILYLVNGWWNFSEPDIILKCLSNKNNPPLEFSKFWFVLDLSYIWFYIEVYGESTYNSDIFKRNYIFK